MRFGSAMDNNIGPEPLERTAQAFPVADVQALELESR